MKNPSRQEIVKNLHLLKVEFDPKESKENLEKKLFEAVADNEVQPEVQSEEEKQADIEEDKTVEPLATKKYLTTCWVTKDGDLYKPGKEIELTDEVAKRLKQYEAITEM